MEMEKFVKKNLKWICIIFIFLFLLKSIQSCNRDNKLQKQSKKYSLQIDSLKKENISKDFLILDLKNELKIAGVKYDEAQKRADAVQKTASAIKTNTTIEVKGVERENNLK